MMLKNYSATDSLSTEEASEVESASTEEASEASSLSTEEASTEEASTEEASLVEFATEEAAVEVLLLLQAARLRAITKAAARTINFFISIYPPKCTPPEFRPHLYFRTNVRRFFNRSQRLRVIIAMFTASFNPLGQTFTELYIFHHISYTFLVALYILLFFLKKTFVVFRQIRHALYIPPEKGRKKGIAPVPCSTGAIEGVSLLV